MLIAKTYRIFLTQLLQVIQPESCLLLESHQSNYLYKATLGSVLAASFCASNIAGLIGDRAVVPSWIPTESTADLATTIPSKPTIITAGPPPTTTESTADLATTIPSKPTIITAGPPPTMKPTQRPTNKGGVATIGMYPWMAIIYVADGGWNEDQPMAASLITDRYLLTAAHFIDRTPAVKIRIGFVDIQDKSQGKEYDVERNIIHESFFRDDTWQNNIALLKLKQKVEFNGNIQPISPLPLKDRLLSLVGKQVCVIGWEDTTLTEAKYPGKLRSVLVNVVKPGVCEDKYKGSNTTIDRNVFCTHPKSRKENYCSGFEGAPLVLEASDGTWALVGVMAVSDYCNTHEYLPSVNTQISHFMIWIHTMILGSQ